MRHTRVIVASALLAIVGASCATTSPSSSTTSSAGTGYVLQVASTDHYVGAPQRVQVGVVRQTPDEGVMLLTSGEIEVSLTPPGGGQALIGEARYIPAPGTDLGPGTPALTTPDLGRGVYQLDATFDGPGVWRASASFDTPDGGVSVDASFPVAEEPALPAPGQKALASRNLTDGARRPEAVDSRALDGAPIPDVELHTMTIADAIADARPTLALFATPVYCQSQFCGPTTDALQAISASGPADAAYIHVEIWFDYAKSQINTAAGEWLLRDGDLTEPWLFLIDADGTIVDRWGPLFDPDEALAELDAL